MRKMLERPRHEINFEKLNITLLCAYPMERPGGVQEHTRSLAKKFTELGHKATIVAPKSPRYEPEENIIHLGSANGFIIKGTSSETAIIPPANTLGKLRSIPTDIMHHQEPELYGVSYIAHWMSGIHHIDTYHSQNKPGLKYEVWKPVAKLYEPRITGRILVSSANLPFAHHTFPGHYEIIPNGVDTKRFNPKNPKIEKFTDGKINILFVGRLEDRKGLEYLMKAAGQAAAVIPNIRLIVVGDGPNRQKYEVQAKELKFEVCFAGAVTAEDLPSYYTTAHVCSFPSPYGESQGIVNHEAQASGVPVVAGDNAGYRTAITNGIDGLLIDPTNTQAYAEALILAITNPDLRKKLVEHGLQTALAHDWLQTAKRTLSFYEESINAKMAKKKAR